jgi:integrase
MRDAISGAGLPMECCPHGLRKAAARRLAEAGCSAKQIMSITGHKTMSEAQRYVDDADQKTLAIDAINKLEADQKGNKFP